MSNPGVIILAEKKLSNRKTLRIEDNLGEAIHLHYGEFRVDLSIQELLYLAEAVEESVNLLLQECGFKCDEYSPQFLNKFSECFADLEKIERVSMPVYQLRLLDRNTLGLPITKNISRYSSETPEPLQNTNQEKIILFNRSDVIMYGEEYARRAFDRNPKAQISIIRFHFRQNRYSVRVHPWIDCFFKWDKKRIYNLLYGIYIRLFKK